MIVSLYPFQNYWNFDLECKHTKHKTAFRARKVIGTFEKRVPGPRGGEGISFSRIIGLGEYCWITYGLLCDLFVLETVYIFLCETFLISFFEIPLTERSRYFVFCAKQGSTKEGVVLNRSGLVTFSFNLNRVRAVTLSSNRIPSELGSSIPRALW